MDTRGVRTMMTWIRKRATALAAAFALLVLPLTSASAMRVSPMVFEMEASGSNSVARMEVQNINQENLAFETRVYRLTFDKDGNPVEEPADDKFLIFPPQGVLPPGGRQVIRLQWVGPAELAASESYYVSVNQLPVELKPSAADQPAAQVQVVYNMRALVVVAPPGATPNVAASDVKPIEYQPPAPSTDAPLPDKAPGVAVTLKNTGRRHAMMAAFGWRMDGIDTAGKPLRVEVTPEELNRLVGTGYVPALGERTFRFPVATAFGPQPIRLTFVR